MKKLKMLCLCSQDSYASQIEMHKFMCQRNFLPYFFKAYTGPRNHETEKKEKKKKTKQAINKSILIS